MKATATLAVLALTLLAGSCATSPEGGGARGTSLDFALIGDMPYDARQEKEFDNLMADIDAAELAFVVHDGDFWWDGGAWTEQAGFFTAGLAVSEQFHQSRAPSPTSRRRAAASSGFTSR